MRFLTSAPRLAASRRSFASAPKLSKKFGEHAESSEQGSGASSDEVAQSDGAFNKDSDPQSSSEKVSKDTGADMSQSAADERASKQMKEKPEGPGDSMDEKQAGN